MSEYSRYLPPLTVESKEFWEGCQRHKLLIQKCQDCGVLRHYPRPMCPQCHSTKVEWVEVSGRGKVYTWTTVRHPVHPAFVDVPYIVVIVQLDEGVRLVSNMVDCRPEDIYIGMPVEVVFEDVSETISLPKFKPFPSKTSRFVL